jgi:fatty-acid desaturase
MIVKKIRALHPWFPVLPAFAGVLIFPVLIPLEWDWLACSLLALLLFDSLGVHIGVHKLLSHRAFETWPAVRRGLAFLSVFSGQGSPLFWVAVHMGSHHPHSDKSQDIHTPTKGLSYAFIGWYWLADFSKLSFAPARQYLADPTLIFIHRNHTVILAAYWIALFACGLKPLFYLGLLPAAISISLVGLVNTFMHSRGRISRWIFMKYQNYPTNDHTFNSVWLGWLTMGLGLHNNHHAHPHEIYYDERWFEWDFSRLIIPLLERKVNSRQERPVSG